MIYEWIIGPANVYSTVQLQNVVRSVDWYCIGTARDGSSYKMSGSVDVPAPNTNTFTDFSKLTKAQVNTWVFQRVSKDDVETALELQYTRPSNDGAKQFNFQ
jgi:hypothetical protein